MIYFTTATIYETWKIKDWIYAAEESKSHRELYLSTVSINEANIDATVYKG